MAERHVRDLSPEDKRALQQQFKGGNDVVIKHIQGMYNADSEPYDRPMSDGSTRFIKSYKRWNRDDLGRVDREHVLMFLDHMAEMDDYDHLKQVLPDSYHGDVKAFQRDIENQYDGAHHQRSDLSYDNRAGDDRRPELARQDPRDTRHVQSSDQAWRDQYAQRQHYRQDNDGDRATGEAMSFQQLTEKAGTLAKVTLVPASDVLPVTVKSTNTMAKAA